MEDITLCDHHKSHNDKMTVYENNNREEIIPECNGTKKNLLLI